MKPMSAVSAVALSLALCAGVAAVGVVVPSPVYAAAAEKKPPPPRMSEKIGKLVKEAQDLSTKKQWPEAQAKIREAEAVPNKIPYEAYAVGVVGGLIYVNLQDWPSAAQAFEMAVSSGAMPDEEVGSRTKAVAQLYYQAKNYPKSIEWAQKYVQQSGDTEIQMLAAQAYYIQKQFQPSADAIRVALKLAADKQVTVKKEWLELLMSADYEVNNSAAVESDLERMVASYPSPKYWQDLLSIIEKDAKDKGPKASLDFYRIMLATGVMSQESEYTEMANMALQSGLPGEAKKAVEVGYSKNVLGSGPQKDVQAKLRATANTQADADQKSLAKGADEARAQKTGDAEVKFGEAYASYGQFDKAIELTKDGIGKGVKDKNDAQLRLGLAYLGAGQRQQALDAFAQIAPNTQSATIGRLWAIESGTSQSASAQ